MKYFFKNDEISFSKYLNSLNLYESTYILSLKSKLIKLHIFLKQTSKNIKTTTFSIRAIHLWFANTNIQFMLDPYAVATYYTSYMKKIKKSIRSKLHYIIKICIVNNIDANTRIQK